MKKKICLFSFVVFFSCSKEAINYHDFKQNTWKSKERVSFEFNFEDNAESYNLELAIRHKTSYPYQNLILFDHHYFENKKLSTDTLNIELASNSGKWYGKGKSDIREFVAENYDTPKTYSKGIHNVELELAMRNSKNLEIKELEGIIGVSLYLSEKNE